MNSTSRASGGIPRPSSETLAYDFEALELEVWVVVRDGGITECSITSL